MADGYSIRFQRVGRYSDFCYRWLFQRSVTADGNFQAIHQKMRTPEDDVGLTNGEGYVAEENDYATHLKVATEFKEVCLK